MIRKLFAQAKEFLLVVANKIISTVLSFVLIKLIIVALGSSIAYGQYVYYYSIASWIVALSYSPANVPLAQLSSSLQNNLYELKTVVRSIFRSALPVFVLGAGITFLALFYQAATSGHNVNILILLIPFTAVSLGAASLIETYVLGQRNRVYSLVLANAIIGARVAGISLLIVLGYQSIQSSLFSIAITSIMVTICATVYFVNSDTKGLKGAEKSLTENFAKQYKSNWPFSVLSNSMLYIDKILFSYFVPIESIGSLALYQLVARAAANLTIGSIYQFVVPIYLGKQVKIQNQFSKYTKTLGVCVLLFMLPITIFGSLIKPFSQYLSDGIIQLEYSEFILICLSVCLNQCSKIIELEYFRSNTIKKLYPPLIVSTLFFITAVFIVVPIFGFIGAVLLLVLTAIIRLMLTLLGIRRSLTKK